MEKILIYKVSDCYKEEVMNMFKDEYEVIDVSSCFEDLLAIPCLAVFTNPNNFTDSELNQFGIVFKDTDIAITFEEKPADPVKVEVSYFADGPLSVSYEDVKEVENYQHKYFWMKDKMDILLDKIWSMSVEEDPVDFIDATVNIRNAEYYFGMAADLYKHREEVNPKEKTAFRMELQTILIAQLLAYGVMEGSVFGYDVSDYDFLKELVDIFKKHREDYLKNGNGYYKGDLQNG